MNWRSIKYPISLFILGIIACACESDYTKLVKSELAKGIRKDSILLGISLGNTRNEFYGKCFDLNKRHVVAEGANYSVQYLFTDSLVHAIPTPIRMLFVPAFDEKEILTNLDLKFNYVAWAPWNKQLQEVRRKQKTGRVQRPTSKCYCESARHSSPQVQTLH